MRGVSTRSRDPVDSNGEVRAGAGWAQGWRNAGEGVGCTHLHRRRRLHRWVRG